MAVQTRYVVMRNGAEVRTFMDKKQADEYDKMLDMADSLSSLLAQSALEFDEGQCEALSIFLAEQRENVLISLQAKKARPAKVNKDKEEAPAEIDNKPTALKEAS